MQSKITPTTEIQLRAMSPEQRSTVRAPAVNMGGEVGAATVALIDSLNLPFRSGGMAQDDPLHREIETVAWSAEGKAAALEAVAALSFRYDGRAFGGDPGRDEGLVLLPAAWSEDAASRLRTQGGSGSARRRERGSSRSAAVRAGP